MFRKHETIYAWQSGLLALMVHALLIGALLFSLNWKDAHQVVTISDVELWDAIPKQVTPPKPKPIPEPEPEPEPKPEPLPEPEPEPEPVIDPEPEPQPEPEVPKVDIELEKKKKEEEKKRKLEEERKKKELAEKEALRKKKLAAEKKRKEERLKKLKQLQQSAFDEEVVDENEKALKELQQASLDDLALDNAAAKAKMAGIVDEYRAKIIAKIKGNMIRSVCGDGSPKLVIKLNLLPTGEYGSTPTLSESSGIPACDDAVERAVIASEPLPLPKEPGALASFRNLKLIFRPNDN